jgi:hypothetical protein
MIGEIILRVVHAAPSLLSVDGNVVGYKPYKVCFSARPIRADTAEGWSRDVSDEMEAAQKKVRPFF